MTRTNLPTDDQSNLQINYPTILEIASPERNMPNTEMIWVALDRSTE